MNKEEGKIFIVTSGEYSGYSIERVFSARKKALEYLDTCDSNYRLEVYDIDVPIERNMHIYQVTFELDKKKVIRSKIMKPVHRIFGVDVFHGKK